MLATAGRINNPDRKAGAFVRIAEAQIEAGDIPGAKASAARLGEEAKAATYKQIAEAQALSGDVAGAKVAAAQISNEFKRMMACEKIAEAQAEAGDSAGAIDYINHTGASPAERCEALAQLAGSLMACGPLHP